MAAAKKPRAAKPATTPASGAVHFYVNPTYVELPGGEDGGAMRAEPGDYVVTDCETGATLIMPPAVFAETYPDLVG